MCTSCARLLPEDAKRECWVSPGIEVTGGCELPCCWELNQPLSHPPLQQTSSVGLISAICMNAYNIIVELKMYSLTVLPFRKVFGIGEPPPHNSYIASKFIGVIYRGAWVT